jgi:hypothetical protein
MAHEPYVEPEAMNQIGVETVRLTDPVSLRHIRTYLAATDHWHPAYHDAVFAATTPEGQVVAPPLFLMSATRRVQPLSRLLEDGQYDDLTIPGIHGVSMAIGWEIEIGAPIHVGDVFKVTECIRSIRETVGRSGKLVIADKQTLTHRLDGTFVARDVLTLAYR